MSVVSELLLQELIDLDCSIASTEEFFNKKADILLDLGYVAESYQEALKKREKEYPTGLGMEHISIAIPHTTVEHIKQPFIYFNRLTQTGIQFIQMGTDDVVVEPSYILMLGITNPKEQVTLLAELMELFNNEAFIQSIEGAKTADEIIKIFKNN